MTLDLPKLEAYLIKLGQQIIGPQSLIPRQISSVLEWIVYRRFRCEALSFNLGGNSKKLTLNVIIDTANVSNLAKHLLRLRQSQDGNDEVGDPEVLHFREARSPL